MYNWTHILSFYHCNYSSISITSNSSSRSTGDGGGGGGGGNSILMSINHIISTDKPVTWLVQEAHFDVHYPGDK